MEFSQFVDARPLATAIDETVPRRPLRSGAPLAVDPADGDPRLRRRAVHHLLSWWLYDRTDGIATFEAEGGVAHVAESGGDAAGHAAALLSHRDGFLDGDRPFDREAAELAIDYAHFDLVAAGSDPPYDVPDGYGTYDDATVAELVALVDLFGDAPGLADGAAVFDDSFGLPAGLDVDPPIPNVVVGSTAYTAVPGPDAAVDAARWRELVGWVLLDDFVSAVEFRWHPPEDELARVDGVAYSDPAEQGSVTLLTLPVAIARVVRDALRNRGSLGLTAVSHPELEAVGVYHAHRGDLQTVDVATVRAAEGYPALREAFAGHLVDAAGHDGLRRIADHFLERDFDDG